jgi:hypothetical protein
MELKNQAIKDGARTPTAAFHIVSILFDGAACGAVVGG